MQRMRVMAPLLIAVMVLLVGCQTLYTGGVTVTKVVDAAMKEWAEVSADGLTTPEFDAKVTAAHNRYRQAAGVAKRALVAYRDSGEEADYMKALDALKVAAYAVLDIVTPMLTTPKAESLHTQLQKARMP